MYKYVLLVRLQSSSESRAEASVGEPAVAVFRAEVAPVVLLPGLELGLALGQSVPHELGLALGLRRPASPSSSSTSSCSNRRCETPDSLLESGYHSDSSTQHMAASASASTSSPAFSFAFDKLALCKLQQPQVKLEPGLSLSPSRCAKDEPLEFKCAPDAGGALDARLGPELDILDIQDIWRANWGAADAIDLSLSSQDALLEPSASLPSTPALENLAGGERSQGALAALTTGAGNSRGERDEAFMNSSFDLDDLPLPDLPLPVPLIGLQQVDERLVQQLSIAQLVGAPASSRLAFGQLSNAAEALEDSDAEFGM